MKIAAKGMLESGYNAHGRMWPRNRQIEISVTREEYAAISRDPHIVSVVIPETVHEDAPPAAPATVSVVTKHKAK
jgi:hypothetical protein